MEAAQQYPRKAGAKSSLGLGSLFYRQNCSNGFILQCYLLRVGILQLKNKPFQGVGGARTTPPSALRT